MLRGRAGNDELIGDAQQRTGTSRGGDDHLYGGTGDDRLYGDFASGGSGLGNADVFHFAGSFGADKILDYEDGRDQIMFKDYIRIDLDVDVVGGNTVITAIGGNSRNCTSAKGRLPPDPKRDSP